MTVTKTDRSRALYCILTFAWQCPASAEATKLDFLDSAEKLATDWGMLEDFFSMSKAVSDLEEDV